MEQLLHYVWKHKLFPLSPLSTTLHQPVEFIIPRSPSPTPCPYSSHAKVKSHGTR